MGANKTSGGGGAFWRLKLLGRPELRFGGRDTIDLPKKAFAIAARLILDRNDFQCPRTELGYFLWPNSILPINRLDCGRC